MRQEQQRKAALTVAAKAMSRLLGREVTKAQAAAIRTPESALSAGDLAEGSRLLCDLETAVLGRNYDGFGIGQERKVRRIDFSFSGNRGRQQRRIAHLVGLRLERLGGFLLTPFLPSHPVLIQYALKQKIAHGGSVSEAGG